MTEYVFRPSRLIRGKRIISRYFCGRYAVKRGERVVTVPLETSDERVARKRLRDIVAAKQREAEGIVSPAAAREAAGVPLVDLLADYRLDLAARGFAPGHVRDTCGRIDRLVRECRWQHLSDIRPESFMRWRAASPWSPKTRKEYQTSINAFLNWLVRVDRLLVNPLAKVDRVDIRGKGVRLSRALSLEEMVALAQVAPERRRMAYLFLAYTGARKNEARSLRWSDVTFGDESFVVLRAENTKSRRQRVVPLKRELAELLQRHKATNERADLVFPRFPSDDALHADLGRAGIPRKDVTGRVVHFHAFRKTFNTWFANSGGSPRAGQEILGHADLATSAKHYTDVTALSLGREVAKLPWYDDAQPNAHERVRSPVRSAVFDKLAEFVSLAQTALAEAKAGFSTAVPLAARHGFEPSGEDWQTIDDELTTWLASVGYAQLNAHERAAVTAICVLNRLTSGEEGEARGSAQDGQTPRRRSRDEAPEGVSLDDAVTPDAPNESGRKHLQNAGLAT